MRLIMFNRAAQVRSWLNMITCGNPFKNETHLDVTRNKYEEKKTSNI